jgi:hypothetical protein
MYLFKRLPAYALKTRYDGRAKRICSSVRKVFLTLDNLPVHHSYALKDWIKEHKGEIEFFYNFIRRDTIQMTIYIAI